jgi:copper resistance protein C
LPASRQRKTSGGCMKLGSSSTLAGKISLMTLWIAVCPMALGHAVLLSSTPPKSGLVKGPDITITLEFSLRVDGLRFPLSLLEPDGTVKPIDTPTQPAANFLSATGHGLGRGTYVLRWKVLAVDGHITSGTVPFEVQ